jgi:two-component system cell cycle sensor histidine kinase/response regulator CckA
MTIPSTQTILVVENDGPIRELASRFLVGKGFNVLVAANGLEALDLAQDAARIDLLISDVSMPHMSGPELAQRLVEGHPETRVLFISGFVNDLEAPKLARSWFLAKPFTSQALIAKVGQILAQS